MDKRNEWRVIDSGIGSAGWNMAVDEALLREYQKGERPILRLYGWENSLSFGRFTKAGEVLDLPRLHESGLRSVRRPSGGGVLVHGGDLSYSLVFASKESPETGVKENFCHWCRFLIELYRGLGWEASFFTESGGNVLKSDVCLAGKEAYDIMINGEKMGGNAQRHSRGAVLQHGTIPLRIETERFEPFFKRPSGLAGAASFEKLGALRGYGEMGEIVRKAFARTYNVSLINDALSPAEEERARELYAIKYSQRLWNERGEG